jgi:hypothetical protein
MTVGLIPASISIKFIGGLAFPSFCICIGEYYLGLRWVIISFCTVGLISFWVVDEGCLYAVREERRARLRSVGSGRTPVGTV